MIMSNNLVKKKLCHRPRRLNGFPSSFTHVDIPVCSVFKPGTKVTDTCELPDISKLMSVHLEEKEALLTTEPSLQSVYTFFIITSISTKEQPSSHKKLDSSHSSLCTYLTDRNFTSVILILNKDNFLRAPLPYPTPPHPR